MTFQKLNTELHMLSEKDLTSQHSSDNNGLAYDSITVSTTSKEQRQDESETDTGSSVETSRDQPHSASHKSDNSLSSESSGKGTKSKMSKRAKRIEEKLKRIAERSLFDTDGDLSTHNILEHTSSPALSTRNSRKRKLGIPEERPENEQRRNAAEKQVKRGASHKQLTESSKKRIAENKSNTVFSDMHRPAKPKKRRKPDIEESKQEDFRKTQQGRLLQHGLPKSTSNNAPLSIGSGRQKNPIIDIPRMTDTLLRTAKTPLDELRNEWLSVRETKLQGILAHHDAAVRELYHLEIYQNMLEYNPASAAQAGDERLVKYVQNHDLWDLVDERILQKSRSTGGRINTRRSLHQRRTSLVRLLQNSISQSQTCSSTLAAKNVQHGSSSALCTYINSGTGLRRYKKQFASLDDYLASFISVDDNEDITPEEAQELMDKEISIRERLNALNKSGGFLTRLQDIANRRPHAERHRSESHHDIMISQMQVAARLFSSNNKYRKNAARRCAKAIDRYWESIRTHDERLQKEESKRMMRLAKWTAQQVKKKWKVVERVCEARYKELLKEEQVQQGRRHLEMILEHSEQMLGVRMEELSSQMNEDQLQQEREDISSENITQTVELDTNYFDDHVSETEDKSTDVKWEDGEDVNDHFIDDDEESEDDHDELEALTADQNLPIERLLEKYNYRFEGDGEAEEGNDTKTGATDNISTTAKTEEAFADGYVEYTGNLESHQSVEDEEFTVGDLEDDDIVIEQDGESEDDDIELNALAEEAELSVEQLMEKYNYRVGEEDEGSDADDEEEPETEDAADRIKETLSDECQHKVRREIQMPSRRASLQAYGFKRPRLEEDDDEEIDIVGVEEEDMAGNDGENGGMEGKGIVVLGDSEDDDRTVTDYGSSVSEDELEQDVSRSDIEKNQLKVDTKVMQESAKASPSEPRTPAPTETIQPTGTTLSTTKVVTKIPFLLRGVLREYQHVGLDWLASLYNNGLNGILADEMGLGKTIQTISLLAYLACEKGVWGPHLIVVPTSVILNWEMEFKKWLPGFKILTYYGNPKERKEKRFGWSKDNAFHVCITSYQLVIQDQMVFRRKAWQYLILDEAHHIKNFRSQRWQVLLNFNSNRRLLLTGTPLQNNLMELWSLLYFLMPNGVSQTMPIGFANQKEFQEWFSHPVDRMIENQQGMDDDSRAAIQKLHTVLRPYLLRRLKADVEKQLPEKHEHIVYCRLSKRQRYLYDDFMSRAKTKETLASGNFLSIINCLMQLRKVCNHPDLFEERPIMTSFSMTNDVQCTGQSVEDIVRLRLLSEGDSMKKKPTLDFLNVLLLTNECSMSASLSTEYEALDATNRFHNRISFHYKHVSTVESRGVVSRDYQDMKKYAKYLDMKTHLNAARRWESLLYVNTFRCSQRPIYGINLITMLRAATERNHARFFATNWDARTYLERCDTIRQLVLGYKDRIDANIDIIERYGFVTPKTVIYQPKEPVPLNLQASIQAQLRKAFDNDIFHPIYSRLTIAFPDKRLLQYDCGKLQKLATLLRDLAANGHRALIFTQMTRVLDVLEAFLNMHGHRYLRLDGATKIEQRQVMTERFNNDKKILCFILSTRSGGLGINLTGADTVIFYDSDWNPSMDKQCQDRTHRIGQTRDVHIYRFVTEYTIEENIFKKANQKRMLDNVVIQEGEFTNDYFHKMDWWRDLPEVTDNSVDKNPVAPNMDIEQALLEAEGDETDAAAAIAARNEMNMDEREFDDSTATTPMRQPSAVPSSRSASESPAPVELSVTTAYPAGVDDSKSVEGLEPMETDEIGEEMQLAVGHVDQYMLRFWEREMFGKYLGFGGLPEPEDVMQLEPRLSED
ncbi:swr1 complex component [Apophysomyces ossiformis]|uniref:Swr1 complex component n=1 Tax=Apophysomyces ossiformis TaxID=679940 RepID=A0A8H7BUP3_9FUNG|nr:swr1 complex component [Apophysomyces ossiformis]